MDGDKVDNSVCKIGMITKFVLLRAGNVLFVTVTFVVLSQGAYHHCVWGKHAFAHVTVGFYAVTGGNPAENAGVAPDTMVSPPLALALDQVINFCLHHSFERAVAANVHES
jgi:hypothetical protein